MPVLDCGDGGLRFCLFFEAQRGSGTDDFRREPGFLIRKDLCVLLFSEIKCQGLLF